MGQVTTKKCNLRLSIEYLARL